MLVMDNAIIHHSPEILELADCFSEFADLSYIVIPTEWPISATINTLGTKRNMAL
jgi:hypothetical protein